MQTTPAAWNPLKIKKSISTEASADRPEFYVFLLNSEICKMRRLNQLKTLIMKLD